MYYKQIIFFNILSASVIPQLGLKRRVFLHFSMKYSKCEWFCDGGNILTASDFDIQSVPRLLTIFFEYSKCESVTLKNIYIYIFFTQAIWKQTGKTTLVTQNPKPLRFFKVLTTCTLPKLRKNPETQQQIGVLNLVIILQGDHNICVFLMCFSLVSTSHKNR